MRQTTKILALLLTAVALTGCFKKSADSAAVAKVGGTVITASQFQERLQSFPDNVQQALAQPENMDRILEQMIDEELLVQAAKDRNVQNKAEYKEQLDFLKKQLMVNLLISEEVDQKIQLSENDLQAYYTQNNALFQEGSQRRASHILVETEGEAKAVLRSLRAGADFAKLAQSRSQDPGSKDRGGDLGFFTRGQLVPEFEKAVFSMKKGEISNPVKTQFGYHVIKLVDLSPAVAYEEARAQIQQLLYNQQKQALTQQLLSDLRESTKIEKNLPQETSETAQAPAVQ